LLQYGLLSIYIPIKKAKATMSTQTKELIARLRTLFEPKSLAMLGASNNPTKWGFRILSNIVGGGFQGRVYPVNINPDSPEIMGLKVYRLMEELPEVPDIAVIVVPPPAVPQVMRDCAAKGVKVAVVITAGFAEVGSGGERLQQEVDDIARSAGIRFVGPNSFGILNPHHKLYSQMPPIFPPPGPFGVISQSGNIIGTISRLLIERAYGCSKCVSIGNQADLCAEDYLEFLSQDTQVKVILCYMEGFRDGVRFLNLAKETTKKKPIILLKAGETPAGAKAAKSHTASLAGSDAVLDAMCRQAGVVRVRALDDLVDTAIAFLRQPLPRGRRVGIVTAGGGWGVLVADACARLSLDVITLPPEIVDELDSFMPAWWNRGNPVDLVAGGGGDTILRAIEILMRCPVVDGVIMLGLMPVLGPAQMDRAFSDLQTGREMVRGEIAEATGVLFDQLNNLSDCYNKPLIVASEPMAFGSQFARKIAHAIADRNTVCYEMPHQAAAVFARLAQYSEYRNQEQ
jgi:acyl-CoA synthetase (NDP forming)